MKQQYYKVKDGIPMSDVEALLRNLEHIDIGWRCDKEFWATIPNYSGYLVSNMGNVASIKSGEWKLLSQGDSQSSTNKYKVVSIQSDDGRQRTYRVHSLVLNAFDGDSFGKQASHISGDILDNRLLNLKWETAKENQERRKEHGTYQQGESVPSSKLTESDVIEIRKMYATGNYSQQALADIFGVTRCPIRDIISGKSWGHI